MKYKLDDLLDSILTCLVFIMIALVTHSFDLSTIGGC